MGSGTTGGDVAVSADFSITRFFFCSCQKEKEILKYFFFNKKKENEISDLFFF